MHTALLALSLVFSGDYDAVFRTANPGQIVRLEGFDLKAAPTLDVKIEDAHGPQFLFSDKPEYFRSGDGIAMQEDVAPGIVRLYVYHCPEPTTNKKTISCVIENLADKPLSLRMLRRGFPKPGGDYHKMGKEGLLAYFNSTPEKAARTIAPHAREVFDPEMDNAVVTKDILVHGLYEFEIDQPARVTTFQRDPDIESIKVIDTLPKLPRILPGQRDSGAGRGLLLVSDYSVTLERPFDTASGAAQIIVADGKRDPWVTGRDSIANEPKGPLKGNYGVMYKLKLSYTSSDGRGLAIVICNGREENKGCRYVAAAMLTSDGAVALPKDQVRFEWLPEAVVVQLLPPAKMGDTATAEFIYSPPGASCLPTPLLLIPYQP